MPGPKRDMPWPLFIVCMMLIIILIIWMLGHGSEVSAFLHGVIK